MESLVKKYLPLLGIVLIGQITYGMSISMLGPSLPYLAVRVNRSLPELGFIFTSYGIAFITASLITGFLFCQIKKSKYKLLFFVGTISLMSICRLAVPFLREYTLLVTSQVGMGMGGGMYDTSINSLVIYIFGPIYSRSITQFLHFGVSLGGFLGPIVMTPFIKEMGTIPINKDYCGRHNTSNTNNATISALKLIDSKNSTIFADWPPLANPYLIYEAINIFVIFVYCALILFNFRLERFHETEEFRASVPIRKFQIRYPRILVFLIMVFYGLLCGQESSFWNYSFSYALCTKLMMTEMEASTLNTVFFIGFLVGRFSGIFISRYVPPAVIIVVELTGCFLTCTTLSLWGEQSKILTFTCFGMYGFFVSMVFASCISWLAEQMDVTGGVSSSWFVGCILTVSFFPPIIGFLFSQAGASSFAYWVTGVALGNLLIFGVMLLVVRFRDTLHDPGTMVHERNAMLDHSSNSR